MYSGCAVLGEPYGAGLVPAVPATQVHSLHNVVSPRCDGVVQMMSQREYEKRRDDGRRAVFRDRELAAAAVAAAAAAAGEAGAGAGEAAEAVGQGAAGGSCPLGESCLVDSRVQAKEWALRNER